MKVFISWSGKRSRHIAECLRAWLPLVLQNAAPWMSDQDLSAGSRWSSEMAKQLAESKAGIICVTRDNMLNPWIMFESGALSKVFDEALVCPYLFDIQHSQLDGPLTQFQATLADKSGTLKLVETLNNALGDRQLPSSSLDRLFGVLWGELEAKLNEVPQDTNPQERPVPEILEEILKLSREQDRQMQNTKEEILEHLTQMDESLRANTVRPLGAISPKGFVGNPYNPWNLSPTAFSPKVSDVDEILEALKGIKFKDDEGKEKDEDENEEE